MPMIGFQSAGSSPFVSGYSSKLEKAVVRKEGRKCCKGVRNAPVSSATRTHMPEQKSAKQPDEAAILSRLTLAEEHQQAELQGSSSGAAAAGGRAAASPREHFEVAASGVYPAGSPPCPLPEAVLQLFPRQFASVTSAKRACRRGEIWLDGTKLKTKSQKLVHGGQTVQWLQRTQGGERLQDMSAPAGLHVVYEDTDLACVAKPQGMPVAGKGGQLDLQTALPRILNPGQGSGALWRPRYVHRLDQPTGGLVMVAKSRPALSALSAAFSHREVKKTYLALVCGRLVGRGSVQFPLEGKPCLTMYQVLGHTRSARHNWVTTVKLSPHTGRRHQLRRHMALIGHPVVNDKQYTYGFATQMLRSSSAAQSTGQDSQGANDPCSEAECDADAEACKPDEASESCSSSSDGSQEAPAEDTNSADIALGRFGREPAARSESSRADPDVLSAATAVQRWEMDHSHGKRESRSTGTADAAGGLTLHRPVRPGHDDAVDASSLCLWAVGLSLTHPRTGALMNFELEEPPLFDAVREREFQAWREL